MCQCINAQSSVTQCKRPNLEHRSIICSLLFCVALGLFHYMYTVFPLGVLYLECSQLAFDCIIIACTLESFLARPSSGLQGPQWCGLAYLKTSSESGMTH